jgi:hypothetical protein
LAAQWLVCLFRGRNEGTSKKEMDKGVLALGGQNFELKHTNQIVIGGHGRRDVKEEARLVWSTGGDTIASILVAIQTTKIYIYNTPWP